MERAYCEPGPPAHARHNRGNPPAWRGFFSGHRYPQACAKPEDPVRRREGVDRRGPDHRAGGPRPSRPRCLGGFDEPDCANAKSSSRTKPIWPRADARRPPTPCAFPRKPAWDGGIRGFVETMIPRNLAANISRPAHRPRRRQLPPQKPCSNPPRHRCGRRRPRLSGEPPRTRRHRTRAALDSVGRIGRLGRHREIAARSSAGSA